MPQNSSRSKSKSELAPSEVLNAQYWIRMGRLLLEKCELNEAKRHYLRAYEIAREKHREAPTYTDDLLDSLLALLRHSVEAQDEPEVARFESAIQDLCERQGHNLPSKFWYCRAVVHDLRDEAKELRRTALIYLRTLKLEQKRRPLPDSPLTADETKGLIWGFMLLSKALFALGHDRRSEKVCRKILEHFEETHLKSVNGGVYLQLAKIYSARGDLRSAIGYIHKAQATYLQEHNWYSHLYILLWYARIARLQQNYSQAFWYLDLLDKAAPGPEFGVLRRLVQKEKSILNDDAADIIIDSSKALLKTRESGEVNLGKQYVLLDILRALSDAYNSNEGTPQDKGLTKSEIIQKVWREKYRPEAHDNKLYYNINRLRKLIEPDLKRPRYLLNWKEGYRFAPGLKVQFLHEAEKLSGVNKLRPRA